MAPRVVRLLRRIRQTVRLPDEFAFFNEGLDDETLVAAAMEMENANNNRNKAASNGGSNGFADGGNDGGGGGDAAARDPFECVGIFKIYSHGCLCLDCGNSVGISTTAIYNHTKKHNVSVPPGFQSIRTLQAHLLAVQKRLLKESPTPPGSTVDRYKCLRCNDSFSCGNGPAQYFYPHVKRCKDGLCDGSEPVCTRYTKTLTGTYVEQTTRAPPAAAASFDNAPNLQNFPPTPQATRYMPTPTFPPGMPTTSFPPSNTQQYQLNPIAAVPLTPNTAPAFMTPSTFGPTPNYATVRVPMPPSLPRPVQLQYSIGTPQPQQFPFAPTPPTFTVYPSPAPTRPILNTNILPSPPGPVRSDRKKAFDYSMVESVLEDYMRDDENVGTYVSHLSPIFESLPQTGEASLKESFDAEMKKLVSCKDCPALESEEDLLSVLENSLVWLRKRARHDVGRISGQVRAGIMTFDGDDVNEVSQNTTFNFRRQESRLAPELKGFVTYIFRHQSPIGNKIREEARNGNLDEYSIPRLFADLYLQVTRSVSEFTLAYQYCVISSFRETTNGKLVMRSCGQVSSICGSVLFLLRAGMCSFLNSLEGTEMESYGKRCLRYAQRARESEAVNMIAPLIRHLREQQRLKPIKRLVTVGEDYSIAVDEFEMEWSNWSKLIPTTIKTFESCFSEIFEGDLWKTIMKPEATLVITNFLDDKSEFSCGGVSSSELKIKDFGEDLWMLFDLASSAMELSFFGQCGGSMRYQEIGRTFHKNLVRHRGTMYFSSDSKKVFSHKTDLRREPVIRKATVPTYRAYILYRLVCQLLGLAGTSGPPVLSRNSRKVTMTKFFQDIGGFQNEPSILVIRQFHTCFCNCIFPKMLNLLTVSASTEGAEINGHSEQTHDKRYHAFLEKGPEAVCSRYHAGLGRIASGSGSRESLTQDDLLKGLEALGFSNYKSNLQEQMVLQAAFPDNRHSIFSLPCGSGKSSAWLVPTVGAKLVGKPRAMSIVVSPCVFLAEHLKQAATEVTPDGLDVRVEIATGSHITQHSLPLILQHEDFLPDILVVNVVGLDNLVTCHPVTVNRWVRGCKVETIFVDEIHTLYGETFRDSYDALPKLARLCVPVAVMSGSLPPELLPQTMEYLRLYVPSNNNTMYNSVSGGNPIGTFPVGFKFIVELGGSIVQKTATRISSILETDEGITNEHHVHVIVESKKMATNVQDKISEMDCSRVVTSDVSGEDQMDIAGKWCRGEFSVLISTTCALVGNENPKCKSVVFCGCAYSLMNLLQGVGRLRPSQRSSTGGVYIYLPNRSHEYRAERLRSDLAKKQLLIEKGALSRDDTAFDKIGTAKSIFEWAAYDPGCRLKSLAARFSYNSTSCGTCDRCDGAATSILARRANASQSIETVALLKAQKVCRVLEAQCTCCGSELCTGEDCLPRGLVCFVCGVRGHGRRNCTLKVNEFMLNRGCVACLDLSIRPGYTNHSDKKKCPFDRRFKRMLFCGHQNYHPDVSFEAFFTKISSTREELCQFLGIVGYDLLKSSRRREFLFYSTSLAL